MVIWRDPLETVWDAEYNIANVPWVIVEWKFKRKGRKRSWFDDYDTTWLTGFTRQNPGIFAYLVQLYSGIEDREILWAKIKNGEVKIANRRS
ncbi:MAG: hypothetical protein GY746_06165 [Gammaproteobacteria bacterium]|nr:hypothetical protein [Gammaproteobacteria bacterium]